MIMSINLNILIDLCTNKMNIKKNKMQYTLVNNRVPLVQNLYVSI